MALIWYGFIVDSTMDIGLLQKYILGNTHVFLVLFFNISVPIIVK